MLSQMRFLTEDSDHEAEDLGSTPIPVFYPPMSLSTEDGSIDSEDNE